MQTVTSKDGTKIAYEKVGNGPAVILITGATMTGPSFTELANLLSPNFTVYYYDRRGRGESSDTLPYLVEKEIEDIDVLIDLAGGSASLYGISSGGCLALEAASKLGEKVTKLAIYEVPYNDDPNAIKRWHEYTNNLKIAISAGDRSAAVVLFMKLVGVPDEVLAGMKNSPMWPSLEKVAPTLVYDAACMGKDSTVPGETAKTVVAPTLIMDGGANAQMMPFMSKTADKLAAVIPHAKRQTLEGQRHDVDSKVLAPLLIKFFEE